MEALGGVELEAFCGRERKREPAAEILIPQKREKDLSA